MADTSDVKDTDESTLVQTSTVAPDTPVAPTSEDFTTAINATTTDSSVSARSTTGQSQVPLYGTYSDTLSTTEQFPMQHATQQLPTSVLPLSTTDYTPVDSHSSPSDSQSTDSAATAPQSLSMSTDEAVDATGTSDIAPTLSDTDTDIPISSTDTAAAASSQSSTVLDPSDSNSDLNTGTKRTTNVNNGTGSIPDTSQLSMTPPSAINPHNTAASKPSLASSDYMPSTGDIATPLTVSKTSLSSSAIALDTVSVKTTSTIPLTPLSAKPIGPSDHQGTSILGGGLSNYIVYVGAPLCGLGILILLIVCILCLRKRKAKSKGSPAKSQVPDLWVNSQAELPLSNRSPLLEARGGDRHRLIGVQDLATSKLRKRVKYTEGKKKEIVSQIGRPEGPSTNDNKQQGNNNTTSKLSADLAIDKAVDKSKGTQKGCSTYEAVFDFPAEQDTHLCLRQGDLVKVTRKEDNGWWRGTIDNRLGWFPSNYVQPAPQDTLETENEVEMHNNESHLSSFLMKKSLDPSPRSSFAPSPRNSYPTEEEIEAEPIYCKIQPKEKRKSTPKVPDKITAPPPQLINRENTPIPLEDGSKFKAIYDYNGHFHGELHLNKGDIILGKEQDRNGWMNGYNETTGEEGWFPAVYVETVVPKKAESPTTLLPTDPASYKQLEANTMPDGKQDLVGIVHKAIHNFTAEKAGDLEFNEGDHITVVQVLENGWWLGCKDKTVGWFPGTFVQMIDQPSGHNTPTPSPVTKEPLPVLMNGEATPSTPKKSKLRPARKAPPPPVLDTPVQSKLPMPESKIPSPETRIPLAESKIPSPVTKIPKKSIPVRAAPSVPSPVMNKEPTTTIADEQKENILDEPAYNYKPLQPLHDGLYDLLDLPEEKQQSKPSTEVVNDKPQVPKRYIKPKLVMIPRSQVKMPENRETNGQSETPRSRPPPPRPNPPRLGPIRAKLQAPRSPGFQSEEEEETGFFHLNHQSNVNDFLVREDSLEPEIDNPYQSLSSFGSTFGSNFGSTFGKKEDHKPANINSPWNKSPTIHETTPTHKYGASFGMNDGIDTDIPTLNDTSPVVLNNNVYPNDDEFVINCNDIPTDIGIDYKFEEEFEPVIPSVLEQNKTVDNYKPTSPDTAEIAVTPTSPKKKEKSSRLAPPKPVTLAINKNDQNDSDKTKSQDSPLSSSSPALSKIPRVGSIPEPVSKLPTVKKDTPVRDTPVRDTPVRDTPVKYTPVKDTPVRDSPVRDSPVRDTPVTVNYSPVKTEEPKHVQVSNFNTKSPSVHSFESANVNDNVLENRRPVETTSANSGNNSPVKPSQDESVGFNDSFDDSDRERTGSFGGDRPPLAPKPKPKSLPKLMPKPKAGIKTAPKESDIEKDYVAEKEAPKESKLPTTPIAKSAAETEDKPKEEEPKQTKLPMVRGRKSQIPASPGLKKKKQVKPDSLQDNRKLSESDDSGIPRRKISESDSDVPLSPVTNIRRKPESPAIARKVKKGEGSNLRNRSNSPHGRTGIPVNLKQRSNSPASKLPRSGIPKSNLASPSPTSNGPSTIIPTKPPAVDHVSNSPSSGPNSPQVDKTPSPEQIISPEPPNVKPDRPSKPPQKQKSQDGKPSKGKSLLPVIHKNMESAAQNGISPSPGSKPKRGIPVAKPPRPPGPKSPAESEPKNDDNKRTLYQAVRGYVAENEFELSFTEGTFIKELSDCDRPGWYVGMLADGTTGLYPASHFKPSPVSAQSEA